MEILFVRHGESTANRAHESGAEYDKQNIVLTEKGIEQAKATGKYIKKVYGKIDYIFHSPIYRCQQTSEIIAKNMGFSKELIPNELLLEFGETSIFDDMTHKKTIIESKKIDKEFVKIEQELHPFIRLKKFKPIIDERCNKYKYKPNLNDVVINYNYFLNQIKKEKYKRILVIGHLGTSQDMINILTGINSYNYFAFDDCIKVNNCSITCVLYQNDKFELVQIPNNTHLIKINEKYK
jgi:broad specificity phosphatase PhoE